MIRFLSFILFVSAALVSPAMAQSENSQNVENAPTPAKKANSRPLSDQTKERFDGTSAAEMSKFCVSLKTEEGSISLEFFPELAPETVRNFLNLVSLKIFDTTTFSRVIPDFIVQGGNISTRGERTPEMTERARRKIPDEPNSVKHERGVISMARGDEPNSASSNFFILLGEAPHLDGSFAAFGRVTSGMDVVEKINKKPVEGEKPKVPVKLLEASVVPCQ